MAIVRWRARALGLRRRGRRERRVGARSKRAHRAARGPDGVHRDGCRLEWTGASQDGFAAAGRRSLFGVPCGWVGNRRAALTCERARPEWRARPLRSCS